MRTPPSTVIQAGIEAGGQSFDHPLQGLGVKNDECDDMHLPGIQTGIEADRQAGTLNHRSVSAPRHALRTRSSHAATSIRTAHWLQPLTWEYRTDCSHERAS